MNERTVPVWQGRVRVRVLSKGSGPALVFFHGPWGLVWDPFLDELAERFTVYAPEHPGTTPGAPDDVLHLDGLWDLVLCYDEVLRALGLEGASLAGHSFGGMMACELAAAVPGRARRLALIAPLGFWRDADRIVNWMMLEPAQLRAHLFGDPDGDAARRLLGGGDDAEALVADQHARKPQVVVDCRPQSCAARLEGHACGPLRHRVPRRRRVERRQMSLRIEPAEGRAAMLLLPGHDESRIVHVERRKHATMQDGTERLAFEPRQQKPEEVG